MKNKVDSKIIIILVQTLIIIGELSLVAFNFLGRTESLAIPESETITTTTEVVTTSDEIKEEETTTSSLTTTTTATSTTKAETPTTRIETTTTTTTTTVAPVTPPPTQGSDKLSQARSAIITNRDKINEVLRIVNEYRASAGLHELVLDENATLAASYRSVEISEKFSHERPNGKDCFTVFSDLGLSYSYPLAENLANGYASASAVMSGWMNSTGHKNNIMNANYRKIGIGVVYVNGRYYWTQLFTG